MNNAARMLNASKRNFWRRKSANLEWFHGLIQKKSRISEIDLRPVMERTTTSTESTWDIPIYVCWSAVVDALLTWAWSMNISLLGSWDLSLRVTLRKRTVVVRRDWEYHRAGFWRTSRSASLAFLNLLLEMTILSFVHCSARFALINPLRSFVIEYSWLSGMAFIRWILLLEIVLEQKRSCFIF